MTYLITEPFTLQKRGQWLLNEFESNKPTLLQRVQALESKLPVDLRDLPEPETSIEFEISNIPADPHELFPRASNLAWAFWNHLEGRFTRLELNGLTVVIE